MCVCVCVCVCVCACVCVCVCVCVCTRCKYIQRVNIVLRYLNTSVYLCEGGAVSPSCRSGARRRTGVSALHQSGTIETVQMGAPY